MRYFSRLIDFFLQKKLEPFKKCDHLFQKDDCFTCSKQVASFAPRKLTTNCPLLNVNIVIRYILYMYGCMARNPQKIGHHLTYVPYKELLPIMVYIP